VTGAAGGILPIDSLLVSAHTRRYLAQHAGGDGLRDDGAGTMEATGYPSAATEAAVQANIVAADYTT
jgi:hypothetical protein